MGGRGSGRWAYYKKRRTVEDCAVLAMKDILPAVREGWGGGDIPVPGGASRWVLRDEGQTILICWRWHACIRLAVRRIATGVRRWFLVCPGCRRHVQKLYLPWSAPRAGWACRACHNLTYTSSQEQRKPDKAMRKVLAQVDAVEAAHREHYRRRSLAHAATDPSVRSCNNV